MKKKEMTDAERKALEIRCLLNKNSKRIELFNSFIEGHIEDNEIYDKLTEAECAMLDATNEIVGKAKTDENFADMLLKKLEERSLWINPMTKKEGK
jgi:hypothetical protein